MLEFSVKKLRFINYFIVTLIFIVSLLLVRNLAGILLTKEGLQSGITERMITESMTQEKSDIMSYSNILEKNPFGSSMKLHPLTVTQGMETIQGSLSDILLVGTVVGPENLSYAVFENKSSPPPFKQSVIAFGDDVLNYGTLIRIDPASVEIKQGPNTFKLLLAPLKHKAKKERTGYNNSMRTSLARKIGEKKYLLNRRRVNQTLENPEQILTDARLIPNIQNGRQEGFKMYEVKRGGLYESLGLRNGDILLRVNGLEISNPEVAIQAMTAIKGMDRINLDIMRNGSKRSMSYQIK